MERTAVAFATAASVVMAVSVVVDRGWPSLVEAAAAVFPLNASDSIDSVRSESQGSLV